MRENLSRFSGLTQRAAGNGHLPQRGQRMAWFLGRGNVASDREAFFVWQERVLDLLVAWGVGNVLAGGVLAVAGSGLTRAIGVQAVVWGAVDSVVALYAQCIARRHALSARAGEMGAQHVQAQAERFEYLLALTTGADVLYVVAGSLFAWKSTNVWVKGTALGVIIQGGALLIYDLGLTIRMLTRPETHFRAAPAGYGYA